MVFILVAFRKYNLNLYEDKFNNNFNLLNCSYGSCGVLSQKALETFRKTAEKIYRQESWCEAYDIVIVQTFPS